LGQHGGPAGLGAAGLQAVDPLGGEVFGARQLRRFGHQRLLPVGAQRIQPRIARRRQVVGAGDLPGQAVALRDQGQVKRLAC
jgi:hypothetical protein